MNVLNRTFSIRSILGAATLSAVLIVNRGVAQDYRTPETDSRVQVVARGGGFPALNPRSGDESARVTRNAHSSELPAYRVHAADAGTAVENVNALAGELPLRNATPGTTVPLDPTPESSRGKMIAPLVTVGSSLAIVLALFCALVWAGRKFGGGAAASKPLPASALTPLGHVMLDPRTKLLLVKCGRRILVLSQTAGGITPITEVTHPDEVRELIANCSSEAREVFQRTLREIELEPAKGFTDSPPKAAATPRASGRLFATA